MNANRDHRSNLAAGLAPLLIAAAAFAAGTAVRAEDAATSPPAAVEAKPAAPKPADAAKPATPGAKPAAPSTTQQRFTPSERVRADFPVSFPVDI